MSPSFIDSVVIYDLSSHNHCRRLKHHRPIQFDSIYCIYVVGLFYIWCIQNAVYIAATVFVLHLGKMTAIISSVLTTLVTNDINTVNKVKSDTNGGHSQLQGDLKFKVRICLGALHCPKKSKRLIFYVV